MFKGSLTVPLGPRFGIQLDGEVQANDVIGMSSRGMNAVPTFDLNDPMGLSSCVACQTEVHMKGNDIIKVDGRQGPTSRGKLCIKGQFGMDYVMFPERLTKPLVRRDDVPKRADMQHSLFTMEDVFREATHTAKRGAKLIVMDPRRQGLMRYATHSVVFKPGRDVVMFNAMINVIIEEELYDEQYIQVNVDGFAALKNKVKNFTPEAMEPVSGIKVEFLRDIARTYAKAERAIIFLGMGVSQHVHGTDNCRSLIALHLITGHVGRPGTGLHPLRGQNNVQGTSDVGLIPMVYPNYQSVEGADIRAGFEDMWGRSLDASNGLAVVEIMHAIEHGDIKGMYVMGENPAMSDPDQNKARLALSMLDHLVVQDIFLTEAAWFTDFILPASAHPEKSGTFTNSSRQVQISHLVRTPPGDARQDWELIVDRANRCGCDWSYSGVDEVYTEMASVMSSLDNISWQRLEKEGHVCYPAKSEDGPGEEIIFYSGFPTKSGCAKIVPTDLVPPDELPDEKFPMVLTTGRMLEHWHTGAMTRRATALDAQEPEAVVSMHPKDIGKMGFVRGQEVTVETRRGGVTLTLRADRDVTQGMLFMPFCFVEAPANVLTNPRLDPYGKIPEFKFSAARIFSP